MELLNKQSVESIKVYPESGTEYFYYEREGKWLKLFGKKLICLREPISGRFIRSTDYYHIRYFSISLKEVENFVDVFSRDGWMWYKSKVEIALISGAKKIKYFDSDNDAQEFAKSFSRKTNCKYITWK